jgi:predicted ABC-type sugar transport system permease subunit
VEQIVISGLAMGSIYALIALSFVLIYNAVGVVNFATGEIVMLGAFLGTTAITQLQLNPVLAYIAACALMVFFGYSFNLITYYPLRGQSFLPIALSTLAASIIMRNVALIIWGANPLSMRGVLGSGVWHLGTVVIVPQNIVIFIVTLVLLVLQHLFFTHTRWGRMMRAVAQDQDVAKLMGIKVNLMIGLTFAYAGFFRNDGDGVCRCYEGLYGQHRRRVWQYPRGNCWGTVHRTGRDPGGCLRFQRVQGCLRFHHPDSCLTRAAAGILRREDRGKGVVKGGRDE